MVIHEAGPVCRFSKVYPQHSTTEQIFVNSIQPLVRAVIAGLGAAYCLETMPFFEFLFFNPDLARLALMIDMEN